MANTENVFGVWSHANQAFISEPFATPGEAVVDMIDLLRSIPGHDLTDAYNDVSVRKFFDRTHCGEKNLTEGMDPVLTALHEQAAK